jgi:hypothetical protein
MAGLLNTLNASVVRLSFVAQHKGFVRLSSWKILPKWNTNKIRLGDPCGKHSATALSGWGFSPHRMNVWKNQAGIVN